MLKSVLVRGVPLNIAPVMATVTTNPRQSLGQTVLYIPTESNIRPAGALRNPVQVKFDETLGFFSSHTVNKVRTFSVGNAKGVADGVVSSHGINNLKS
jgi:hypothetical protein